MADFIGRIIDKELIRKNLMFQQVIFKILLATKAIHFGHVTYLGVADRPDLP